MDTASLSSPAPPFSSSDREVSPPRKIPAPSRPLFTHPLRDQIVTEGNRVTLECVVNPFPIPDKVQWFRNEIEIHSSPDYLITYHNGICKLVIAEAFPEDTGKFKCVVTVNGVTNSSDMHLKVQGRFIYIIFIDSFT